MGSGNRIVILSEIDYAGSGFKLYEALKRHTPYDLFHFSGKAHNKFKHPISTVVTDENKKDVQKIVDTADIIHFKGDWPPSDIYLGLNIPNKPIVTTVSGTFFRKKEHGGFGRYTVDKYKRASLKTSFETDLLYPEYSDIWTPHPIDSDEKENIWKKPDVPIFMHIPSTPGRKGTEFVKKLFEVLKSRMECITEVITGVSFEKAQSAKKKATIYFDQFFVGFYGNSALEAMQWGIPTAVWFSPWAIDQAKGKLNDCPLINLNPEDVEGSADKIITALNDNTLSLRTKEWCDRIHGYRATAELWSKLYNSLK